MNHYYFIGIGGTAMASVAAALRKTGARVSGSDNGVYPPMSTFLEEQGVAYHNGFSAEQIVRLSDGSDPCAAPDRQTMFVIGNAISRGNPEAEEVLDRRLPFTSLAALVGERLIAGNTSLVVAGTHGKTTTASLAAWVLEHAGRAPGFLIGGIPLNFGEGCRPAAGSVFVSEGDEYDTAFFDKRSKFVHYRPDIAIINNLEFDHADIFTSVDDVVRSFRQLTALVPRSGLLLVNGDDARALESAANAHTTVETFGTGETCDWRITGVHADASTTVFDVACIMHPAWSRRYRLPLSGEFNARNALGVLAACARVGLTPDEVQRGFDGFRSVRRRMDVIAELRGITVVDDFAHHPTAIRETLRAAAARWPDRRIVALFEPRSNTTTRRIFQHELAEALACASVAIIGAVNRADRYSEEERLSIPLLLEELSARGVDARHIPDPGDIAHAVAALAREGDVIMFLSNGSFGGAEAQTVEALRALSAGTTGSSTPAPRRTS